MLNQLREGVSQDRVVEKAAEVLEESEANRPAFRMIYIKTSTMK